MKEMLDKAPRWFILTAFSLVFAALWAMGGFMLKRTVETMDTVKTVAYQAKVMSVNNQEAIIDLRNTTSQIRASQETFRVEYRQDQKDLDRKMNELLRRT